MLSIKPCPPGETEFFVDLPAVAANYALPTELTRGGAIRRCGAAGQTHAWAWRQAQAHFGGALHRLVSLRLADEMSAAAILDGRPVETTAGYTATEGIISARATGDIDSSVGILMYEAGLPLDEIERALALEGGLSALMDKPASLVEVLRAEGERAEFARRALLHSILVHLGGLFAALGGADAVVVSCAEIESTSPFVEALHARLAFTGAPMLYLREGS